MLPRAAAVSILRQIGQSVAALDCDGALAPTHLSILQKSAVGPPPACMRARMWRSVVLRAAGLAGDLSNCSLATLDEAELHLPSL